MFVASPPREFLVRQMRHTVPRFRSEISIDMVPALM